MKKDSKFTEIIHESLKHDGVKDPEKVDVYVDSIYNSLKKEGFSLIESETIAKYLAFKIDSAKKLALREPLTIVDKYEREE